jgi:assimilatory nitrate reductase catalytic subunit
MMRLMTEGDIAGCLVLSTNPVLSMPDTPFVCKALDSLEYLVVLDPFMSETAEMADVVLPSAMWVEDEGTVTNLEGRMLKINHAAEAPGEARPDWWILREIARRMGRGEFFQYDSPREIFEELRLATKGGAADYSGLTWEKIEAANGGVFEPCVSDEDTGEPQLFKERFAHPDGKARFIPAPHRPPAEEPNEEFPFYVTNGRVLFQYLTANQTRRIDSINSQAPQAFVEINQREAERLRITNGTVVRVRTPRGSVEVKASIVNTIRPDTLFLPMHYSGVAGVNRVTNPVVEPSVKIPELKIAAATVEPVSNPVDAGARAAENYSPETDPAMYPYTTGDGGAGNKGYG